MNQPDQSRPAIPVLEATRNWPVEMVQRFPDQTALLLDNARATYSRALVSVFDRLSKRWLVRSAHPFLGEIDAVASAIARPGAHFLNVSYEWACSSRVAPDPTGEHNALLRVLDWPLPGLGRSIIALRHNGPAGDWINFTWPGFTGVIQAMAPGRFAAAINQAPVPVRSGVLAVDWLNTRRRAWRTGALPPAHLLRQVFETAPDYASAREMLIRTPLAVPTIFLLSGISAGEGCVIERLPFAAKTFDSPAAAANHFQGGWRGHARSDTSEQRASLAAALKDDSENDFDHLSAPVINQDTRLVMRCAAATGRVQVQGFEADGAATALLEIAA